MSYMNDDDDRKPIVLRMDKNGVMQLAKPTVEVDEEQFNAVNNIIIALKNWFDNPEPGTEGTLRQAYNDLMTLADDA